MNKAIGLWVGALLIGCGSPGSGAGDPSSPDAGTTTGELRAVSMPQAIGGAMWANPIVYPQIPLDVAVEGAASSVIVTVEDQSVAATDSDGDGTWTALVDTTALDAGFHTVGATATAPDGATLSASAELGIGTTGIQLTDFASDGAAATPRLHRVGSELWLTWADRSSGTRRIYLRRLDGAGRWQGERIQLLDGSDEILEARVAVGKSTLGVLYQKHGGPYSNYFERVDSDGNSIGDPIELDPKEKYGSFGGDISYDGSGFVMVWRCNDGAGGGEIRWLRVDETSGAVTGPVVVATSGAEDPVGGFDPVTFIGVEPVGELSLVSFVRKRYDEALDLALPKGQIAVVDRGGAVMRSDYATPEGGWMWNFESRIFSAGGQALLLWSAQDLTASDPIPTTFRGALVDSEGTLDPDRGDGALVLEAPDHRVEPFFMAHPRHFGVLAWLDERSYAADISSGRIELYTSAMSETLNARDEKVFSHARFIEGTSQLNGTGAGDNLILVWLDERHGNGITDPRPEVWLETAWY
jgi:hypothetical protein